MRSIESNSEIIFLGYVLFWNSDSRVMVSFRVRIRVRCRVRRVPMWQQSGTLQFCSCHGIAGFLVHELEI